MFVVIRTQTHVMMVTKTAIYIITRYYSKFNHVYKSRGAGEQQAAVRTPT